MYELKKIGKVFMSKFVRIGPSSYKKRIYQAAVSQRLRNTGLAKHRSYKTRLSASHFWKSIYWYDKRCEITQFQSITQLQWI